MSILKARYWSKKSLTTFTLAALTLASASAVMQGCSGDPATPPVDCVKNATNAAAKKTGFDLGHAAGMLLTEAQGKTDGYPTGHSNGQHDGYYFAKGHGPVGYDQGKADGYATGLAQGQADVYACSDGTVAGANDGYASGLARGHHEGYADGYDVSSSAAFTVGQYSCSGAGDAASDQNSCQSQGHDAGYAQAKNTDNKAYILGVQEGSSQGYADGLASGKVQGYNDGKSAGQVLGLKDGQGDAYVSCYNAAFVNGAQDSSGRVAGGKLLGYDDGYFARYNGVADNASLIMSSGIRPQAPSVENGLGGQGDGFHDGYISGRLEVCPNAPSSVRQDFFFGHGSAQNADSGTLLPWFQAGDAVNPLYDTYAETYSAYMSSADIANLDAQLAQYRTDDKASLAH